MSSSTRISPTQPVPAATTSVDTTTKKKFGKNLNKLTAPPVAPIVQENNKFNSSSKNGFLLLSTKRASGIHSGAASGGILSSKSAQNSAKPIPSLGLHTEFASSTHDALLGVVVGASRVENQQQPDAWGVAEKQQQENTQVPKEDDSSRKHQKTEIYAAESHVKEDHISDVPTKVTKEIKVEEDKHVRSSSDTNGVEFRTSNWDEYGGRDLQTNGETKPDECNDEQVAFMTKLARKRAEKRRDEEETRMMEQKERAARRLRELEEKMACKKKVDDGFIPRKIIPMSDKIPVEFKNHPKTVLEKLQQKGNPMPPVSQAPARTQRTLFDPNAPGKSYSSLVGGSSSVKQEKPIGQDQSLSLQQSISPSKKSGAQTSQGTYTADPESFDRNTVVQLGSFEGHDRGDRTVTTAPRMLFDPKSGSMVEVSSRDEGNGNGRNRKAGKKSKNLREKNSKKDLVGETGNLETKGKKKVKPIKDIGPSNQRGKGTIGESKPKTLNISEPRKLPRTCGVLYSRGTRGGFVCTDGCDGDLGYGVHSVPGGRVKNAEAYTTYLDRQKIERENATHHDVLEHGAVVLETGFHVAAAKTPKHEWIKPNEKIELITGNDDSPTLQATAREWAPRHSNFSLSDRRKSALSSTASMDEGQKGDLEADEDETTPLGLGFDPALNMDSVMQSPSMDPSDGIGAVDLTTLTLEPALKGASQNSHIFAFESGATWGASNSEGSNDWGMHPGSNFRNASSQNGGVPTSFLSLSTGSNTWGGFGTTLNGENGRSTGD